MTWAGGAESGAAAGANGGTVSTSGFGPSALLTPANAITMARLLTAPLFVLMVLHRPTGWATVGVWFVLSTTDGVDGWLARRHGTTRSGAFLDPLADKFLVLGAMFALVSVGRFSVVPVVLIATREVGISMYRSVAGRHGISMPARPLGKVKTLVQDLAVGAALLPLTGPHTEIAVTLLWLAVALTVVSGAQYVLDGRHSGAGPAAGTTGGPAAAGTVGV